jgi:hypothetical protein
MFSSFHWDPGIFSDLGSNGLRVELKLKRGPRAPSISEVWHSFSSIDSYHLLHSIGGWKRRGLESHYRGGWVLFYTFFSSVVSLVMGPSFWGRNSFCSQLVAFFVMSWIVSWLPLSAQAQVNSSAAGSTKASPSSSNRQDGGSSATSFEFRNWVSSYSSEVPGNPKLSQNTESYLLLSSRPSLDFWTGGFDGLVGQSWAWNRSYWAIHQLYGQVGRSESSAGRLRVGRARTNWSEADGNWQLGLWQPLYNVDPLRPETQGLSGIFWDREWDNWNLTLFASPLYLPSTGPEVKEDSGNLVSDSRWLRTPATNRAILNDRRARVTYSLRIPDLRSIVAKEGYSAQLSWGKKNRRGPWTSLQYAYKPLNSLLLRYDATLVASAIDSQGEAILAPEVGFHRIAGWDVGWRGERVSHGLSVLFDRPLRRLPSADPALSESGEWVQSQPGDLDLVTWRSSYLEPGWGTRWNADLLWAQEQASVDYSTFGQERGSINPWRLNFSQAAQLSAEIPVTLASPQWNSLHTLRWLRDFSQQGSLFTAMSDFRYRKSWSLAIGVDVLQVDDGSDQNRDPRFLNQFRANDRVFGGLGYVF